jgi:glycine oxidase
MKRRFDYSVIGGGIAGLTCARALARRGASVALVEKYDLGFGASMVAAGMLSPIVEARLEERRVLELGVESLGYYGTFVRQLQEESGIDVDLRRHGTLFAAVDRDQAELLEHLFAEQRDLGLPVEWLSGYECRQREPYLAPGIPAGIISEGDHQVDNRKVLDALAESCRRLGVTIVEGAGDASVTVGLDGETTIGIGEEVIESHRMILATGARADLLDRLLPGFGRMIRPVKGQIMRLNASAMPIIEHVVRTPEVYLAPKSDGRIVLGASTEDKGFNAEITAGEIFELLRSAWECVPAIYELPIVETAVGFRPASIDHAPLIGATSRAGVYLALGYYRHGILFAPFVADLLARHLIDGESSVWLDYFSPRRFDEAYIERPAG